MDFIIQLFTEDTVAHTVLILGLVAALGLLVGSIRVFGINLGIAGVLFAGLAFGHFGLGINEHVLEFAKEFGLILFVYTIGVQVGPGFTDSLRRQGLPLNIMAASVVLLGVVMTLVVSHFGRIDIKAAVGLYSGAVTNTPSLGAAQQALKDIPGLPDEAAKLPGLGYAIAYPFGIIGIILTMLLVRALFRVNIAQEGEQIARIQRPAVPPPSNANLQVTNPNLDGLRIRDIPGLAESGVVISRILHEGKLEVAHPETVMRLGDVLHAVGPEKKLRQLQLIVGSESDVDLKEMPSSLIIRRLVVTRRAVLGKTLEELDLVGRFGVTVTRVSRAEIEFTPTRDYRLQFGDTLLAVGEEDGINRAAAEVGNSARRLNHPEIVPIFVGIVLGVIVGSWPVEVPGMPAPVKLGLAGGPLVVAILLSRLGRVGPLVWYMPISANFILREVGIVLFLACVGLRAGDQFVATLVNGDGLQWMAWATLITLVPLLVVALVARAIYRVNYLSLCGLLAGSMTDPPALAFATNITGSDAPNVSYATVYPLVMLLRVLSAQAIVLLLVR
ncbi:MAG: putative transport protein [Armatimonadota bacterium]|nr:MAG: putative transport protein [Armatimonadota bacterium]